MNTIPQNQELIKELSSLLESQRAVLGQRRVYERILWLILAEIVVFGRHTIAQMLMSIGYTEADWSGWYRLFSAARFRWEAACEKLFEETLQHVGEDEVYVVAGDGTQTRRSSLKMEGAQWLHNPQSPLFARGIHIAQRWFNGSWLMPAENGYSRAMPLRWLPAFTEKSNPQATKPRKEWECAVDFLEWLLQRFEVAGRTKQKLLMVGDGTYDTINLWKELPDGVILMARSAKNRALFILPKAGARANRKYGERAPTPQQQWAPGHRWDKLKLTVRGLDRHLQIRVEGPYLRKGVPERPLFLIVVRGKDNRRTQRIPLPFLVNAVHSQDGGWQLPLPVEELLFWSWQRWEVEVAHRELKSNFGLGHKQCWSPIAAVQWSAWVYSLLLLAGYRCWGLTGAPSVPTAWWRGSGRWSLNTLWRGYRAALWHTHTFSFTHIDPHHPATDLVSLIFQPDLRHAAFAAANS